MFAVGSPSIRVKRRARFIEATADYKFSQNKQENDESSLAERSEGQGVAATFMAPWVGSGTYPVYFVKAWFK